MNDDNNDKPRGRGAKPFGDRPKRDFKGGKPGDRKPGGKKPFVKRADNQNGERSERPKRDFKRDDRPRAGGERGDRPFSKGPRPERGDGERKPFVKRADAASAERGPKREFKPRDGAERADRPAFRKASERGDGERKPFVKREGGAGHPGRRERTERAGSETQADRSRFKRDDRPRGGDFADRPKREFRRDDAPLGAGADGDTKPFRKEFRREDRPFEKREGGDRKPYATRDGAERKPYAPRPDRSGGDPESGPRKFGGDKPRSFGSKSHEGQKRSYGMKSHGADRGDKRPFGRSAEVEAEPSGERIAKRLARAGIASRRDAEDLIAAGRVKVNGKVLSSPAFNVMPDDAIMLDGTEIPPVERTRLFLFHKPAGLVTTNRDPEGRKTVFDVLPADLPRLMTVGRLDINTEGLLLLTNDGGLSRMLELPATGWLRRYRVRVHGKVEEQALKGLKDGIAVDGVFYGGVEAELEREQGSNAWLSIGLREGKNREVKNILGSLGLEVTRLIRISYGPFQLGELPEGHVLEIKGRTLRDQLGERLIEEAGANFDADIVKPFSNKPVRRTREVEERQPERPKTPRPLHVGEGGLIKNRKRRENSRDEALGKLTTRPERGARFERPERPDRPKVERGERPERPGKFGDRPDRFATFDAKPGADTPKPRGGKKEREQRPFEPPKPRTANVWMAPGARPQGTKSAPPKSGPSRSGGPRDGSGPRPGRKPRDR